MAKFSLNYSIANLSLAIVELAVSGLHLHKLDVIHATVDGEVAKDEVVNWLEKNSTFIVFVGERQERWQNLLADLAEVAGLC